MSWQREAAAQVSGETVAPAESRSADEAEA